MRILRRCVSWHLVYGRSQAYYDFAIAKPGTERTLCPQLQVKGEFTMTVFRGIVAAVIVTSAVIVNPAVAQGEADSRFITADDLLMLRSVGGPQISPDREWIAYTVNSVDVETDESSTQIYMVSRNGEEVVQLTSDDYSADSPQWSPDDRFQGSR